MPKAVCFIFLKNRSLHFFLKLAFKFKNFSKLSQYKLNMQTPFIKKIKYIVEEPEYEQIIGWAKGRTAIEIRDEKKFEIEILPLHFRHNKMPSFIRQLNLYGFKKIRSANLQTFTHPILSEGKGLEQILSQRKKSLVEAFEVKYYSNREEPKRPSEKVNQPSSPKEEKEKEKLSQKKIQTESQNPSNESLQKKEELPKGNQSMGWGLGGMNSFFTFYPAVPYQFYAW